MRHWGRWVANDSAFEWKLCCHCGKVSYWIRKASSATNTVSVSHCVFTQSQNSRPWENVIRINGNPFSMSPDKVCLSKMEQHGLELATVYTSLESLLSDKRMLWITYCYTLYVCIYRDSKCLALIDQMVRAFGINLKVGGSSPPELRSRHFLSHKLWHFHKNTRSCVKNECCCPRTVIIWNVDLTSNLYICSIFCHGVVE